MKLILSLLLVSTTCLASLGHKKLISGQGVIWGMDFLPGEKEIIFTERKGKIFRYHLETKKILEISGGPKVVARNQGGLLDIKISPKFKADQKVYMTYSKPMGTNKTTALAVGVLKGNKITELKDLFIAKGESTYNHHFGSRLAFDKDQYIFMTVGDRGYPENAQTLSNHYGKVLRLNMDGSAPKDNPFVGIKNALPEIWSYGHRNPQGLVLADKLYEMEHGPQGGDEINTVEPGKNYGWPIITYGVQYGSGEKIGIGTHKEGMEQPLKKYIPSIAPSGMAFYPHKKFSELTGSILSGSLKFTHLNVVDRFGKNEKRLFGDLGQRVRSVLVSEKGDVFFGTDEGNIFQITASK